MRDAQVGLHHRRRTADLVPPELTATGRREVPVQGLLDLVRVSLVGRRERLGEPIERALVQSVIGEQSGRLLDASFVPMSVGWHALCAASRIATIAAVSLKTIKLRPRLIDVAEASGVTVSIASRVLNGDPTVSVRPETRARISEAAAQLAYIPNALARGLRQARTMTIGLVLPDVAYAVNAEIIRGAERSAAAEGYVVLIADAAEFGPTGIAYERLVMEGRVDGLLVASSIVGEGALDSLRDLPLPVVHVNRRGGKSGVSVSLDD